MERLRKPTLCSGASSSALGYKPRGRRIDVDAAEPLDIQQPVDIEHIQRVVGAERRGSGQLPHLHAVVQELDVNTLVGSANPSEEYIGHSHVRFDTVRKGIVHGLVASEFQAPHPRSLHQLFRRRDDEEQIHGFAEPGQQIAPGLIRIGREAVKPKAIDQQMGHLAPLLLQGHITIQLLVHQLQFLGCECARVFVGGTERAVVQQLLAPDVGTDQREVAPADTDVARELSAGAEVSFYPRRTAPWY